MLSERKNMNKIVFLTTLLFLTASCTQGNIMLSGQNTGIWKDADGKTFEIQRNPNPKEAYDFTVTLIDAPKELQATMAGAFYVSDCQLTVNKAAGANTMMSYILPIHFNKIKDNVYQATVYKDALLEKFPNGSTCNWKLFSVEMYFEPTPNIANIRYLASIDLNKENQVAENQWRVDNYISRHRFNQKRKYDDGNLFTSHALANKNFFGTPHRNELATIRLEVKGK